MVADLESRLSILRAPDDDTRHEEMRRFVADLRKATKSLALAS